MSWVIFWCVGAMFTDGLITRRASLDQFPSMGRLLLAWPHLLGRHIGGLRTREEREGHSRPGALSRHRHHKQSDR